MQNHMFVGQGLLVVRAPTTRKVLTKACVELFLFGIPIFNEDSVTLVVLPFIASVVADLRAFLDCIHLCVRCSIR